MTTSIFNFEYLSQSFYNTVIYNPNIFIGSLILTITLIVLVLIFFYIRIIPKFYKHFHLEIGKIRLKVLNKLLNKRKIVEGKIIYLDGLRGLAAFIVVIYHHFYGFYPKFLYPSEDKVLTQLSGSPLNIFYNGNFAVYIFFILSGYVLTYKFFKTRNYGIIISSAARRYIRLLVPVLFFLGKISFSMYVIHFIIVNSFSSFVFINAVKYTSYNNAFLITFCISVTFILFCSYLIYKYIDLMGIRLSKYVFVKYFKKRK